MPPKRPRAVSDNLSPSDLPPGQYQAPTSSKPNKRARFADPEEDDDPSAFAAQVDAALEEKTDTSRNRRGKVKVEGYESDSSDDGEGVVLSRRKDGEDDDDMFAAGSDNEDGGKKAGGKKKDKFLSLGDIEGQEFGHGGGKDGSASDISSEEEAPEDEDDAIRRSKAGMGFEFTKFNMKEEMEEGKFVEDGTYVRSRDAHAIHDRWLEDVDESAVKKARKAKKRAEKVERERLREEERQGLAFSNQSKPELEKELVTFMRPSETVLEALSRLGKEKKKKDTKQGATVKKRKAGETVTPSLAPPPPPPSDIDRFTALATALMTGDTEIYSATYEGLLRSVRKSGIVASDWLPPVPKYEYRWAVEGGDNTIFGPFAREELDAWHNVGYFGEFGEKVKVRQAGNDQEWRNWEDVFL